MSNRGLSLPRLEDARFLTGRGTVRRGYRHSQVRPGCMSCVRPMLTQGSSASIRRRRAPFLVFWACSLPRTFHLGPLPCTVPVASVAPMIAPPRHGVGPRTCAPCRRPGRIRRGRDAQRRARCCRVGDGGLARATGDRRQHHRDARAMLRSFGSRRPTICRIGSKRAMRTRFKPRWAWRHMSSSWN